MDVVRAATVQVIHKHRIGAMVFARVSELIYRDARPFAVLTWIHSDGLRLPCLKVELDAALLHGGANRRVFRYEGTTVDPRYEPPDQPAA
jgi:hypothetical protein